MKKDDLERKLEEILMFTNEKLPDCRTINKELSDMSDSKLFKNIYAATNKFKVLQRNR